MRAPIHALMKSLVFFGLSLFGLGTILAAVAPQTHSDGATELVRNGDFTAGTSGWRTNGPDQHLDVETQGGNHIAILTTGTENHAVLNDHVNTVTDTGTAGQDYVVTARLRTATPNVNGALRIREVTPQGALAHQSSFWLPNTEWHKVKLKITTTHANTWLDVNIVAWQLRAEQDLQVDFVSMQHLDTTSAPLAEPITEHGACGGTPPGTTEFGASVYTVGQTTQEVVDELDKAFGHVPVLRIFNQGLPRAWDHEQAEAFLGRTVVTSFRAHPSEINSGQHDNYIRNWFATAPDDQIIYWSYFHEPEPRIRDGVFTEVEYKQAWTRLAQLAAEACKPNMFSTLILTGWTAQPTADRSLSTYDAGPDVIDVVAFDPYNAVYDPAPSSYISPDELLGPIGDMMESEGQGRPWAIAELGSRLVPGDRGQGRARWLTDIGKYVIDNDGLFVTYFQSTEDGNWRLDDPPSRAAWQAMIEATSD